MSQRYIGGLVYNPPNGWSGQFSGANYLSVASAAGNALGSGDFTIQLWFYLTGTTGVGSSGEIGLIGCGNNTSSRYTIRCQGTSTRIMSWWLNTPSNNVTGTTPIALNTWYHVALVRSGSSSNNVKLYLNGILESQGTSTYNSPADNISIGRGYPNLNAEYTNGYISNVRIVVGTALYTNNFTPPTGALLPVTNTALLTCRYSTFIDGSTNNYTITNNSSVTVSTTNPFPTSALPDPALGGAGNGTYTLSQYASLLGAGTWPAYDPYYKNVVLNLHGNAGAVLPFNTDASTNNFQVTQVGDTAASKYTPFIENGYWSNLFNGSSGVTVSSTSSQFGFSGDFTWEAWVNLTSLPSSGGNYSIICSRGSVASNSAFQFLIGNSSGTYQITGTISISSSDSNLTWNISSAPSVGTWYHVAIVRSGSSVQAYWNGTAIGSAQTASGTTNTPTVNPSIGFRGGAYNDLFFNGYISNFRMVGSAVYTSNFTPSTTPLTAISGTRILTCQSNRFVDNSTNAFTLAAYSAPSVNSLQPFTAPTGTSAYGSGYFDGSDYLYAPGNAAFNVGSGEFCVEAWVYPISTSTDPIIFTVSADARASNNDYGIYIGMTTSQTVYCGIYYGVVSTDFATTTTVTLNAWNHVAMVRRSGVLYAYINGVQGGSIASTVTANFSSSWTPKIGYFQSTSTRYLTGYISNLRFVVGSPVYTGAFTPPTSPLTAVTNTQLLTVQTSAPSNNNTFLDSSTNNFTITRNGNTTQGAFTPFLPAGYYSNYFDGSGDYLSAAASSSYAFGTSAFTIEMWVYMTAYPANYSVLASNRPYNSGNNTTWFTGLFSTGVFRFSDSLGTVIIDSPSGAVPLNAWTHLAAVRSSTGTNGVTLYINGASVAQGTCSLNFSTTSNPVIIGTSYDPSNYYITGFVSNLRVVNGTAVYTAAFTPPVAPLTAITNTALLTCQANRFMDSSANNLAITKNGDTSVQGFVPFRRSSTYSVSNYGGSAYFDGSGDYLTLANNTAFQIGANDFCMEMWVYGPTGMVFWAAHQSGVANGFYFETGGLSAFPGNNNFITFPSWTNGQWIHAVCTRTGGRFRLFQNGVLVATTTTNPNINMDGHLLGINGGDNFASAAGYFGGGRYINGSIPTTYQTASTTTGTQIFTPPTSPFTTTSQGATSADVKVLVTFTNAAIIDDATINNLETSGNTQISTSVKKYGSGSIYMDGASDGLFLRYTQNFFLQTSYTIEAWVYPATVSGWHPIFTIQATNASSFGTLSINQSGTTIVAEDRVSTGGTFISISGGVLTVNNWYHVALSVNSNSAKLFLNGTQIGSTTTFTNFTFSPVGVSVGANANGFNSSTEVFNGYIDDVRITRGIARYTANFTPPTSQLQDQ